MDGVKPLWLSLGYEDSTLAGTVSPAWRLLHRRLTRPLKQWSFWTFAVVGIGLLGCLAVIIEWVRYGYAEAAPCNPHNALDALKLAAATAGLAIAGPAAMQLLYSRDKLAIVVAVILFAAEMVSAMYLMVFGRADLLGTIVVGAVCVVVGFVAWWLANGEDDIFQDEVGDDAAGGGDPLRSMAGGQNPARI